MCGANSCSAEQEAKQARSYTVKGGRPALMCPTALMPERERRWQPHVRAMLTMATVIGPSAAMAFSFLHRILRSQKVIL